MKKLIFNGYQAEDLGFVVVEGPPEILAQEDYEVVTVEGRNGSLIINKGTYPDIEKTFTITAIDYIDEDDIEGMMNNIKQWFFNVTDNRLFYAFDDRYNIVKKVIFNEDIRTSFEQFGDFQVTFLCEPFYYANERTTTISYSSVSESIEVINNDGDFASSPNIKIYGSGNISLYLNEVLIAIKNVSEYVEIDTKLLICIDANGNNKNSDFLSDFPTLDIGETTVEVPEGQAISQIIINPRIIYR